MAACGLAYPARPPALARLAHIRAVLAARLWLQSGQAYADGKRGGGPSGAPRPRRYWAIDHNTGELVECVFESPVIRPRAIGRATVASLRYGFDIS